MKNVADIHPLAPTQTGMLFHSLAAPNDGVYVDQLVIRYGEPVDAGDLEAAWRTVVDQRPVLRSAFVWDGMERPLQVLRQQVDLPFSVHDWSGKGGDEVESDLTALLDDDRKQGFDLTSAPAMRLNLLETDRHPILVWTFHHVLLDGWSAALVLDDVAAAYAGAKTVSRRAFKDHIAWLADQDASGAKDHWTAELAGFTQPTGLPGVDGAARQPRSDGSDYGRSERLLSAELTDRAASFARAQRVTLGTVVQAAWGLLLSRFEGSDDVMFGVTSSGRPAELVGADEMVGMFITTMPTRLTTGPDTTIGPWLRDLQARQLAARDHDHPSLVDIRSWTNLPPGQDLFTSIVVMENFPESEDRPGPRIDDITFHEQSNFPLSLLVLPGDRLGFKLVHDRALVDDRLALRLLECLATVVEDLVSSPDGADRLVDSLAVTSPDQRALVDRWADGPPLERPEGGEAEIEPLPSVIAGRAETDPDDVAVACGREVLTYRGLIDAADALAAHLTSDGIGPGSVVGIHIDRSVDLIVGIMAALRAGAAYLPLDPSYPPHRLGMMIEDADAAAIITDSPDDLPVDWAGFDHGQTVVVSRPGAGPGADRQPRAASGPAGLDDPAYLIYTSGSTGTPNGVVINHANLAGSTAARIAHYGDRPAAFLLLSSVAFDSSVAGIFWTLATGGTLVIPEAGRELDVSHLAELVATNEVSHTLCLPSLYRLILDHGDVMALQSLTTVIVAGEPCTADLVQRHHALVPGADLHNEYGPTEATVWCTVHLCDPQESVVPIGRPVPGATVRLLDRGGNPVPPGAPGQLYVGGPGVVAGYRQRPELTADRFVEMDGRRWFRTGDMGRYRADGAIEFLGRGDGQIKIRGVRIEIGEIEAVLDAHPAVARSAAAVETDGLGPYLVAHVELAEPGLGQEAAANAVSKLRDHLAQRLPDPYVPSRIATVDRLTLLPNGKIDRKDLAPIARSSTGAATGVAPRNEIEAAVAEVWRGLLPDVEPGVHDDFFDIGGHSLLAVTLVERLRTAMADRPELNGTAAELRLGDLLAAPTIAAQADLFRRSDAPTTWRSLAPVKADGDRPPLYLVPPAAGTALSYRELSRHLHPDQPLYSFEPAGADGVSEPHQSVGEMADLYLEELLAAQPDGRFLLGGSCLGALVAWEMACKLDRAGTPVDRLLLLDPGPPRNGPTWSVRGFDDRSKGELAVLAARHAVKGTLPKVLGALRKRRSFSAIRQMHQRAQRTYTASALDDVDLVLFQSAELAAKPHVIERWRILAGEDVDPIVIPATTHDGLMAGETDQVRRMATLIDHALGGVSP